MEPASVRAWWRSLDRRWLDAAVALLLLADQVAELAVRVPQPGQHAAGPAAYGLAAALVAPIVVHRRYPLPAALVSGVALVLYGAGNYPPYPGLPVFVLVFGISLHTDRRRAAAAAGLAALAMSIAVQEQPLGIANTSTWVTSLLAIAVSWLLGENRRNRRARWAAMEERTRRLEAEREERARQAVIEERLRIARELHDVVAHSMSVIAVQSGVANHVMSSRPEQAHLALATIESTSRDALVEMRRLLGVLRQGDESVPTLAPSPGLDGVADLADQLRRAGVTVDLTVHGDLACLPPGVNLSAYRIVQEGLTNVLRHGGPAARVTIRCEAGVVDIEICDDGSDGWAGRRRPAGLPAPRESGHGLLGMRERVAVYGGQLSAEPLVGGGFRLSARLSYASTAAAGQS
jgi:signal transduction histidine kinase